MEFIKKKIYQITTTGTTTGCTGTCRVIIPDTTVIYNLKVLLTQETDDIGFFDAYTLTGNTVHGTTGNTSYVVTGECLSRLNELKKYTITTNFNNQYTAVTYPINSGSTGVDYNASISGVSIVYYINGIKYIDVIDSEISGTTFSFIGQGINNPNFINVPYYKDFKKENIISNPKIDDDVFIIRQEISAFDKNYRLEDIKNLSDLETYASGSFFNIMKNS